MIRAGLWQLVLLASTTLVSATTPTRTSVEKRAPPPPPNFVTAEGRNFVVNGSTFQPVGTNAYWLQALNTDKDIDDTFATMASKGINVVRTWAFNDVETVPVNGTWIQLINNGTLTINDGPNGLQRLDKIVQSAQDHGIYLILSLTNNWNPRPLLDDKNNVGPFDIISRDVTPGTNNSLPRNTLSNDYGGMDIYVRQFGNLHEHDQFYVSDKIKAAFMNYTTQVVKRYTNSPSVLGWELANDPRCNSTLPAASTCATTTVTDWHITLSAHVKSQDPNHLVSSGNQGFFCADCPKRFPPTPPPPPQVSPAPGQRRRAVYTPLTKAKLIQERKAARKKQRRSSQAAGGIRVRGRWMASPIARQADDQGVGSSFDGSQGVDSEDILNIPDIGFATFQLFPDQNSYGPDNPDLSAFDNLLNTGLEWINRHAQMASSLNKPVALTGFGLVTDDNSQAFVPFNSTVAPFGPDQPTASRAPTFGITQQQRDQAYTQWLNAGIAGGLSAMLQYQWGQSGLTTQQGTTFSPTPNTSGQSPSQATSGQSPNDGYSSQGTSLINLQGILQQASQQIGRSG